MLAPQYTLAKNLGFDGGTTAKINDTFGFNFQFGYNFNEHWSLGGLFSWSRPDYQAVVQRLREPHWATFTEWKWKGVPVWSRRIMILQAQ